MFKPSLKRSLSTQATETSSRFYVTNPFTLNDETQAIPNYRYASSIIVPPSLFNNHTNTQQEHIFNPLDFHSQTYPDSITEMLNQEVTGDFIARDVGIHDDIFWCFNGQEVILWHSITK